MSVPHARFCTRCGRERLAAARFCVGCGLGFPDPPPPLELAVEPVPQHPYPVGCRVGYQPQRLRALTIFRLVLALPHLGVWLLLMPLSLAVSLLTWPVVLVLGRLPASAHRFQAAVLAYVTRLAAYLCLATDRWPPFPWQQALGYPVQVTVDPPAPRSRLRTLFVLPMALPAVITALLFGVVAWMLAVGAWLAIIATGRFPRTIDEMLGLALGFQCRVLGYLPLLLTDVYPWYESGPLILPSRRAAPGI